jgi:hypothetical protein
MGILRHTDGMPFCISKLKNHSQRHDRCACTRFSATLSAASVTFPDLRAQ